MKFLHYLYDLSGSSKYDDCFRAKGVQNIDWSLLPSNIANEGDKEKFNDFAKETFIYFSKNNKKFTYSTQVLHPNLIRYFVRNKACKIVVNDNKEEIYLVSTDDENVKTEISKQIRFGYDFTSTIRKIKNKRIKEKSKFNPLLGIFDDDDNIIMKCEHFICNDKIKGNGKVEARIDFTLKLKTIRNQSYFLGLEFLEERAHKNQGKIDYNKIQQERETRILISNLNVKHFAYVWESYWNRDDGYREWYVGVIESVFNIYDSADNREEFGIQYLNRFIGDMDLSRILFRSYSDKDSHLISYNQLIEKFEIMKGSYDECFKSHCEDRYNLRNEDLTLEGLNLDDSEDDSDDNSERERDELFSNENENIYDYIIDENGDMILNSLGLLTFTQKIERKNFAPSKYQKYKIVYMIFGNIGEAAVHAINKVYDMTNDLVFNDIYKSFGLSHRENEPDYPKIKKIHKLKVKSKEEITNHVVKGKMIENINEKENVKTKGNKKEIQKIKEKINEGEKVKIKVNNSKKNKQQNIVV